MTTSSSSSFSSSTAGLSLSPTNAGERIVKLNIGGNRFITTRETLTKRGENFFTSLLSGKFSALRDEKGYYFIDRDGQYFAPILEYLRTGEYAVPANMREEAIAREALFYSIQLPIAASVKLRNKAQLGVVVPKSVPQYTTNTTNSSGSSNTVGSPTNTSSSVLHNTNNSNNHSVPTSNNITAATGSGLNAATVTSAASGNVSASSPAISVGYSLQNDGFYLPIAIFEQRGVISNASVLFFRDDGGGYFSDAKEFTYVISSPAKDMILVTITCNNLPYNFLYLNGCLSDGSSEFHHFRPEEVHTGLYYYGYISIPETDVSAILFGEDHVFLRFSKRVLVRVGPEKHSLNAGLFPLSKSDSFLGFETLSVAITICKAASADQLESVLQILSFGEFLLVRDLRSSSGAFYIFHLAGGSKSSTRTL